MRIISGIYRGRKITAPKNEMIRPTSDKVKEAVFNMIAPFIIDAVVCDLFSGTGNLGLESLSQGAKKCYFCDSNAESIRIIKSNIEKFDASEQSIVLRGDFENSLKKLEQQIDVFFVDPPYEKTAYYVTSIAEILGRNLLSDCGIIVFEHESKYNLHEIITSSILEKNNQKVEMIKQKKYGRIMISIFQLEKSY